MFAVQCPWQRLPCGDPGNGLSAAVLSGGGAWAALAVASLALAVALLVWARCHGPSLAIAFGLRKLAGAEF